MSAQLVVRAHWDPEAEVWVAMSDDVPGLVTEAETPEQLEAKLRVMIPEVLRENGMISGCQGQPIPYSLHTEREAYAEAC